MIRLYQNGSHSDPQIWTIDEGKGTKPYHVKGAFFAGVQGLTRSVNGDLWTEFAKCRAVLNEVGDFAVIIPEKVPFKTDHLRRLMREALKV